MPRHVYDPAQQREPAVPEQNEPQGLAAAAHDDLAVTLPSWDLLPPAEFVQRRPPGA